MSSRGKQPSPPPRVGEMGFGYEILGEPTYTYPMPPAPDGAPQPRQADETVPPPNASGTDPPADPPSAP